MTSCGDAPELSHRPVRRREDIGHVAWASDKAASLLSKDALVFRWECRRRGKQRRRLAEGAASPFVLLGLLAMRRLGALRYLHCGMRSVRR